MTSQTPGGCSIHLTYAELMEREAINYTTGCTFKFYHLSFFHQKSQCFLTLKILFCVVHSQSTVCINFTLPLLQWTLPDKPVVCNQANIDPFNICSNNVQAKACYWWHTIFICFLHTKRNLKKQSAKPQPHCCTKIQDSHLPESETKSQRALWRTYPWCDL